MQSERQGALLVNLGTPNSPSVRDVRRYLAEFLDDPRVLDLPTWRRCLLLHGIILRTRPAQSAEAYRQVWTERGSPLLVHGEDLANAVQEELGGAFLVQLAMRYGQPSIDTALDRFHAEGIARIRVLLLFPQYSSSAWGSAAQAVQEAAIRRVNVPALDFVPPFFADSGFLDALAANARRTLQEFEPEHTLLSFHGIPERQARASEVTPGHCLGSERCCQEPGRNLAGCYRAQCFATALGIRERLGLSETDGEVVFQSRLGRTPWIRPYFDERVRELARAGVRRLLVLSPSFVADCLETLEEIGMRAEEEFRACGGEALRLVPSLNSEPGWVQVVARLLSATSERSARYATV